MVGPLSTPNGDVRIIRGHIHEEFVCMVHMDKCNRQYDNCHEVPLREYLTSRNKLVTGKTKK